ICETVCLLLCDFFCCYGDHGDLHSFPTRRSSDLGHRRGECRLGGGEPDGRQSAGRVRGRRRRDAPVARGSLGEGDELRQELPLRSEEHTSELQSLAYLVCRLLLEKKKITKPLQSI